MVSTRSVRTCAIGFVASGAMLASCSSEWRIRFQNQTDSTRTAAIEAIIRRETCDGAVVWRGTIPQGGSLTGVGVPALADGRYAFDVTARDADCTTVAAACVQATAPFRESVVVTLLTVSPSVSCAPSECDQGVCACESACGDTDAGMPDAPVGVDAPPAEDAFVDDDAPLDAPLPGDAWAGDAWADDAWAADAWIAPPAFAPQVVSPWNGVTTGAPITDSPLDDPPLRPEFVWTVVDGAASYVVELARCDAASWRTCTLDAPTAVIRTAGDVFRARPAADLPVATTAPVGARYVFRVGACTTLDHRGCSYSDVRYLDVGRSASDVDGDGTGDLLAIGDGVANDVLYDVEPSATTTMRATAVTAESLGLVVPVGDYDGDGRAESIVLAPASTHPGGRWLFVDDLLVGGEEGLTTTGARFGERVVPLGDVDADGYADFAVTAPGIDVVRVYYGGSTFDPSARADVARPSGITEFAVDVCGPGDISGDGRADLAILTRESTTTAMTVRIYSQRDPAMRSWRELTLLSTMTATGFTELSPDGYKYLELDCRGDVDGDGSPDLVIGRHRLSTVTVITASRTSVSVASPTISALGWALALGDLDGTGRLSILASRSGIPDGGEDGTALVRFAFSPRRLTLADFDASSRLMSAGSDYDGDGRDDAVIRDTNLHVHLEGGTTVYAVAPPGGRSWGQVAY